MRCVACGVDLIAGKQFCHACGTRVGARCRGCGATVEASFRFCPDCGLKLAPEDDDNLPPPTVDPLARILARRGSGTAPQAVASLAPVAGERKLVTVLFCDLVGSVGIAERLDPEEYHDLLEQYLDVVFPEIYRMEGVVNQLAGDGLMALFGAPVAHEDAPQRAVHAALAIREALEAVSARLQRTHGMPLQIRIGINTGPVVVGPVGDDRKMDYAAIGDTTNLASRLQTLAQPGTILISESTHRLVRGFFAVEAVGPLGVRGKSEPVMAYVVQDWHGGVTRMRIAEERGLTPFVGRESELSRLVESFARLADGQTQVVAVVGDAGSGKSRLVYEFQHRLGSADVAFFEGRCASMMQALPYHPFMMMFARYFDLDWDEPIETACAKVGAKFGGPYEEVERTYPLLCRFLSLPIESLAEQPAEQLRRETFSALGRLLMTEAESRPVVMVLEDLQWIDEPSRELLDDLVRRIEGAPVLVVVTHRSDTRSPWRVSTALTQIALRPLAEADAQAVVRSVAGSRLPRDLEQVIVAKAGGSPFFAEELVRGLVEEGHVARDSSGALVLTRALADLPIPSTVQEVIAARLDALAPEAKRVIQVAAVLGRQFRSRQLEAVLADEGIDLEPVLAELERRGLVHRKTALSSDEFRFGESLTQEVAYEGLLLKQRRQLHERVGTLLEADGAEGGPGHAALLAHHYVRSDNQAKALDALLEAAHEAEQVPSYRVAAEQYRQAWRLAETMLGDGEAGSGHRAALRATLGVSRLAVYFGAANFEEAERAAARGLELAELLGDGERIATLQYYQGVLIMMRGDAGFADGLALAEKGVALARESGPGGLALMLTRAIATSYAGDGRFAQARESIEPIFAELVRTGHRERATDMYLGTCWTRDLVLYAEDEYDEVLRSATEAFALAERAGNFTMRSALAALLAPVHYMRGDYRETRRWADIALEIGELISNKNVFAAGAALALASRIHLGEPVDLATYAERIEIGLRAGGLMQVSTRFVGEALLTAGDLSLADRLTALLVDRTGGRFRQALVLVSRGDVLARLGRLEEARRCYAEAIAIAEAIGSRSTLAVAWLGQAELAAAQGLEPVGLERAAALCAELGLRHYQPRLDRLRAAGGDAAAGSSDA
jgi:class 3 adenylate cyclase/tetratricopeptide (TPR) repeat protein